MSELRNEKLVNAAIDFHGAFGDVWRAQRLFDGVADSQRDVVCVGAMMNALLSNAQTDAVLSLFARHRSLVHDASLGLVLRACVCAENRSEKHFAVGRAIAEEVTAALSVDAVVHCLALRNSLIHFFGAFR